MSLWIDDIVCTLVWVYALHPQKPLHINVRPQEDISLYFMEKMTVVVVMAPIKISSEL